MTKQGCELRNVSRGCILTSDHLVFIGKHAYSFQRSTIIISNLLYFQGYIIYTPLLLSNISLGPRLLNDVIWGVCLHIHTERVKHYWNKYI